MVGPIFCELAVPSGVNSALYAACQALTGVAELLEPFDGPLDIWRRHAKLLRNVAVVHSLLMQHQNSDR